MIKTRDDLLAVLRSYEAIALIGNSEGVKIDAIVRDLPERTLFIFFTGCAKVLNGPFPRDAMLCHRLIRNGMAFLKSQRHFDKAYSFFPQGLKGECGIIADRGGEHGVALAEPRRSDLLPVVLDFDHAIGPVYPAGKMPTTGFAVALWLLGELPDAKIWLCGFTGVAGLEFHLYHDHDWTFEQTAFDLFQRSGRLSRHETKGIRADDGLGRLKQRFPEFSEGEIALVATEVLARRFGGMERQMAKLWSMTKVPRKIRGFFKRIRSR